MKILKWMVLPAALWAIFFYSAANAAIPTVKASSVSFTDTDLYRAKIGGTITIGKASNESNITSYVIRWGLAGGCSAANSYIGEVAKTGSNLTFQLPAGTAIPGAVYEILVYTKNSSGEMLTCQSTRTTIKDVIASTPVHLPRKVKFMSTPPANPKNLTEPYIAESVEIYSPSNVSDITHYAIYWGDSAGNRLGGTVAPLLGRVAAKKDGSITRFDFASGLKVESGGIYVIVCPENYGEQWCGPLTTTNKSNLGATRPADLLGMNSDLSHVKSLLSNASDSTCDGFSLVSTCGDKVCNGNETATTCPSDCSTFNLASYNYQTICSSVQTVYHPVSVAEIQTQVKNAVAQGKHIKVSGAHHSATDVMCGDGVVIAMDKINMSATGMTTALETFEGKSVVNVPAGTTMYDLGAWLHARGKSLGYASIGYAYPTVAGLIGTGSHGSSPTHANVLAHRVVSMNIVGPDGVLKTYSAGTTGVSDPDLWKAMKVNLGYFGVITSVRLEVQNDTNLHVRVSEHTESEFFDQNPGNFFDEISYCDFGQLNWFPATGKILKTCGMETTEAAEAGAHNMLLTPTLSSDLTVPQSKQAFQLAGCHPDGNDAGATMERLNYNSLLLFPPFVKTISGQTRRTMDVVGPQYQMITSPLIDTGMAFFQMDWEVAVPAQNMQAALVYVRSFLHGQNNRSRNISLPLVGVFTRFSKTEDTTLMAYTGTGGPFQDGTHVVHIEMPIYVPIGLTPSELSDYMAPYEEVVTRLITDFGARAHPAKNRQWSFDLEKQLGSYGYNNRFQRFSAKVGQFDPTGVFANPFAKKLGITYPNFTYPATW